ncbi:MAG TPA: TetR family transcriptional regulator [Jatrophihabitans sp.]|jgi:AcrR family transcriptional regulator
MTIASVPTSGLAERKKQRTREELATAAITFFLQRGYDATTVEDIVAAVDVSPRTFYRYFPAKEDLVLAIGESHNEELVAAVRARPASESPLTAVQNAIRQTQVLGPQDLDRVRSFRTLLSGTSALRGRWLIERQQDQQRLAAALADREGKAPEVRHVLAAAAVLAAVTIAFDEWVADGEGDPVTRVHDSVALLATPLLSTRPSHAGSTHGDKA